MKQVHTIITLADRTAWCALSSGWCVLEGAWLVVLDDEQFRLLREGLIQLDQVKPIHEVPLKDAIEISRNGIIQRPQTADKGSP
jgi:hypothetical protein